MSSRKEMVPADSPGLCGQEWRLLCRIRKEIGAITMKYTKAKIIVILTNVIHDMNNTFDDWPGDPK